MSNNQQKSIQQLLDDYLESGLSAREFVEQHVDHGDLSPAQALKLLSIIRETEAITFKLTQFNDADTDDLQVMLFRKEDDEKPVFNLVVDADLNDQEEALQEIVHKFAKELAILATHNHLDDAHTVNSHEDYLEEWLNHPNILPASNTRH